MKKALILGTNAGQADIIEYLSANKWEVHACGHIEAGPGVKLAHHFHLTNTLDVEAVKSLAVKIKADIVYSISSDSAIRTATRVSEELGLPTLLGSQMIDMFHYKDRLRQFLNEQKISTVGFRKVGTAEDVTDWDIFPCVVKPTDSQGQRGVQFIEEKENLYRSITLAIENSVSGTAIIEEYLSGIEISTNVIVQHGKLIINEFTERLVHGRDYFGLPKGHSIPVRSVSKQTVDEARRIVERLVEKLSITDAVLYIQMVVTDKGPKIVEVAPRLDGCHIWRLLKIAKGYDLREYAIHVLTGEKIEPKVKVANADASYTLKFHQLRSGLNFLSHNFEVKSDYAYNEFRYLDHEKVIEINGSLEVVGYYVQKG
jgi:phosphoribosylamine-glycine ligase